MKIHQFLKFALFQINTIISIGYLNNSQTTSRILMLYVVILLSKVTGHLFNKKTLVCAVSPYHTTLEDIRGDTFIFLCWTPFSYKVIWIILIL